MMTDGVFLKESHRRGCDGELYRIKEIAHVDRMGRIGNGGKIAHDYRCNMSWDGCTARVLVLESALRAMAVAAEAR